MAVPDAFLEPRTFLGKTWWMYFMMLTCFLDYQRHGAAGRESLLVHGSLPHNVTRVRHHHSDTVRGDKAPASRKLRLDKVSYSWVAPWSWTVEEFPNPAEEPFRCGSRRDTRRVCDPNRILSDQEARDLEAAITQVCTGTGCACSSNCTVACGGYVIGVAVVSDFRQQSTTTAPRDSQNELEDWADYLRMEAWNLGECDNDVIIVLHVNGKRIFTSVGDKCREKLTPSCCESVEYDADLLLSEARYGQALLQIVKGFDQVFHDDFKCVLSMSQVLSTGKRIGIVLGVISIPALIGVILVFVGPGLFKGRGGHKGSYGRYNDRSFECDARVLPTLPSFSPLPTPMDELDQSEGPSTAHAPRACAPLKTRPGVHISSAVPRNIRQQSLSEPKNQTTCKEPSPPLLTKPSPVKDKPRVIEELTLQI